MSRTYRNTKYCNMVRKPKTQNARKNRLAAEEEILEELGPNYLKGNFAHYKSIPTSWDDKFISASYEYYDKKRRIESLFHQSYGQFLKKSGLYCIYNIKKNIMYIYQLRFGQNTPKANKAVYFPFFFNHPRYSFPVVLREE